MFSASFHPAAVLLVALSLSIGWGIRGNYGHELGAMFPGALAAIAAALVSGRADWQARVASFAMLGGMGWAFGGSISYMQVIGYTHSGDLHSQVYGFAGLFLIGFLWAALGGAGTALPAVLSRQRLNEWFRPLAYLLAVWTLMYAGLPWLIERVQTAEGAMRRQESALYWFDADWLPAATVLVAMLLYDLVLYRRRRIHELVLGAGLGAALGWGIQQLVQLAGLSGPLKTWLVRPQGDTTQFPAESLVTNWPNFFIDYPQHVGWLLGLVAGVVVYAARNVRLTGMARLIVYLAAGWLLSFLLFPVLCGIRLTPPRSDDWAGILGAVLGLFWFCYREDLPAVAWAALVSGTVGGLGFSGVAALKLLLVSLGNPTIETDPAVVAQWAHWQSANWHSFLEQAYGFVNGLGIALALGAVARRTGPLDDAAPRQRWTEVLAVAVSLPVLSYVNLIKNVHDWTQETAPGFRDVPQVMKAPLWPAGGTAEAPLWNWPAWEWTAWSWFTFFFAAASLALVGLLIVHLRRPLAVMPTNWLGRGQLLYLVLMWTFVIGNFGKALSGFHESRLLTEGIITLDAVLATILVLTVPRPGAARPVTAPSAPPGRLSPAWAAAALVVCLAAAVPAETWVVRQIYGDRPAGHASLNLRFGPQANWRVAPILKGQLHR